jgi:hypothetical protein
MGKFLLSAMASSLILFPTICSYSQTVRVSIDRIDENSLISGHVTGLDKIMAKGYRVVVYVHTDKWYIHPYAGQGEGKSWSSIADDGSWTLETVKRDFPADEMTALVVAQGYAFPARTDSIATVKNIALTQKRLRNTPDFGKL